MSLSLQPDWKKPRADKRAENHWRSISAAAALDGWQQYQRDKNFIETDYSERPSNNGLDLANPGFAFSTKLAKFIVRDGAQS